jgi:hypothetical protein
MAKLSDRKLLSALLEMAALFAGIVLVAGEPVPGVNESHYLPKAKHALDPSFASRDLFLSSHDSHWLSATLAGGMARALPLFAVAWVGRLICWSFMAYAWRQLRRAIGLSPVLGFLALISWYFAVDFGNWAGEWAIGGFEGKSIAYSCIVIALAQAIRESWSRVWIWCGLAVAWHPLAGGWAGLSFGIAWLLMPNLLSRVRAQLPWLAVGAVLGLIGLLPAAFGLQSPNRVDNIVASSIHVYFRLYHHLCPRLFAFDRHVAGAVSLSLLLIATWRTKWNGKAQSSSKFMPLVVKLAWISVVFAVFGLAIDLAYSKNHTAFASPFLRFYWFRWFDIVVPLAWTLTFWKVISDHLFRSSGSEMTEAVKTKYLGHSLNLAMVGLVLGSVCVLTLMARRVEQNLNRLNPVADDIVLEAPANQAIASDRYVDWLAVCAWIHDNSPEDSLWFTPEFQQTFKWYAQRAEVVSWKDVPQDNRSLIEWYKRVKECRQARTVEGGREEWKSSDVLGLAKKYDFRWVLVDRRIQKKPLDFELIYPVTTSNRSFAIFRIPEFYFSDDIQPQPSTRSSR